MKYEYLNDDAFLKQMDVSNLKEQFIKITLLSWDEKPLSDLQGTALSGSINLDGSSAVRRTANIVFFIENTHNTIYNYSKLAINKKVKLEIGLKNNTTKYLQHDIIWYPMGIYVILQSSIAHGTSGVTVNLQLKDKMCLLNGECGGVFPASVVLNELETFDGNGNTIIIQPTIYQLIQELVNHWGGEQLGKIIIKDIDSRIKKVMKWNGSTPLYLYNEGNGQELTTNENKIASLEMNHIDYTKFEIGQDIGYIYTDFVYPKDDLVGDAGATVCQILDTIKNTLGNYEYFYDLEGNFIFQEIQNYLNTSYTNVLLNQLNNNNHYLIDQAKGKSIYNFDNSNLIISYNNNPQFSSIKNDFIVWGQRKTPTGVVIPIRYHLAIDTKPVIGQEHTIFQYEDKTDGLIKAKSTISYTTFADLPKTGIPGIFYYVLGNSTVVFGNNESLYTDTGDLIMINTDGAIYQWDMQAKQYTNVVGGHLANITSADWRTELYLQGVDAEPYGTDSNYYYTELQNEWPKLYDIWSEQPSFYPEVVQSPDKCDFFLDFIDSTSAISEFSVSNIGRRSKVVIDNDVNCLFAPPIPDLVLLQENAIDLAQSRYECEQKGQEYTQISESLFQCLTGGGGLYAAYDVVRNLLYEYTSYNENITIQTIPIYHLDVNTRISVFDNISNISGDYIIHTLAIPLGIQGTMSITATKALERI